VQDHPDTVKEDERNKAKSNRASWMGWAQEKLVGVGVMKDEIGADVIKE
jgi:hypothetical protein